MNVLERKRRANGVDYFKVTDNKLTFLNYNPLMSENKTKLFDASKDTSLVISANQDAFTLQTYTAPTGDEISDTVTVYYTSKGRNGQATAIAKIDAFSPELEILYSKNYEYYAIVNNESPNPQANGTTKHYRWNPETKQWEHFLSTGAKAQTTVPLYVTKQYFPMLVSSEFTYRYDANHNADTRIVNYQLNNNIKIYCDGNKVAEVTPEEFERGSFALAISAEDYMHYTWEASVRTGLQFYPTYYDDKEYFYMSDGRFAGMVVEYFYHITGSFIGTIPYISSTSVSPNVAVSPKLTDEQETYMNENPDSIVNPEETDPSVLHPVVIDTDDADKISSDHGNVYLLEDATPIDMYSAGDFDNGNFTLPDFQYGKTYFLKIAVNDDEDGYVYFKWDDAVKKWVFRVNTAETPKVIVPVTLTEYPRQGASNGSHAIGNWLSEPQENTGDNWNLRQCHFDDGTEKEEQWLAPRFDKGTVTITLDFSNKEKENYTVFSKTTSEAVYQYVGIDPICIYENLFDEPADTSHEIPTNAHKGDTLIIEKHGTGNDEDGDGEEDGVKTWMVTPSFDNDKVNLPEDGDYTITDTTTGLQKDIKVETDDDGSTITDSGDTVYTPKNPLNLTDPEISNHYVITTPDGNTIVDEGELKDGKLDSFDDIGISGNQFRKTSPYLVVEITTGISNSTNPDDKNTENGFLAIINGNLEKIVFESMLGDVNLDGKVNVKDVVMQQKYILNIQKYQIQNYINGDMNRDGKVNVIDLALLKKVLTKS